MFFDVRQNFKGKTFTPSLLKNLFCDNMIIK